MERKEHSPPRRGWQPRSLDTYKHPSALILSGASKRHARIKFCMVSAECKEAPSHFLCPLEACNVESYHKAKQKHTTNKWEYHKVFLSLQVHSCRGHLLDDCLQDYKRLQRKWKIWSLQVRSLQSNWKHRHIYREQWENNLQVLHKQASGEGWGIFPPIRRKAVYLYMRWGTGKKIPGQIKERVPICIPVLWNNRTGPQRHLAKVSALPLTNCFDLGHTFDLRRK